MKSGINGGNAENTLILLSAIKSPPKDSLSILNHHLWGKRSQKRPCYDSLGSLCVIHPQCNNIEACSASVTVYNCDENSSTKMILTFYSCSKGKLQSISKHFSCCKHTGNCDCCDYIYCHIQTLLILPHLSILAFPLYN